MHIIRKKFIAILFLNIFLLANAMFAALPAMMPRSVFFKDVMEVDEATFRQHYDHNTLDQINIKLNPPAKESDQPFTMTTPAGTFSCGHYEQKTIKEIANAVAKKALPGGGTFNVHLGKHLDVAAYQADPNNAGAVFQVASNFNGLETTAYDKNIETETLTDYTSDYTQGPFASISAAPGLIYRRFFLFHGQGSNNVSEWGQLNDPNSDKAKNRKVNLLENIQDIFVSPAGYPCFDDTITTREWQGTRMGGYEVDVQKPSFKVGSKEYQCKGIHRTPTAKDFDTIQMAYHANIPVLFGKTAGGTHQILNFNNPHTVDQIFAAAVDLAQGTNEKSDKNIAWAKTILRADYQGALQAAFLKGKKRVFLTLMGGGAFGNDFQHIFDAMYAQKDFIIKSGLEVILIWRPGLMSQDEFQTLAANLEKFANETGGQITVPKGKDSTDAKYDLPPISQDSSPQTPPATPTPETPPAPKLPKDSVLASLQTSLVALKTKLSELAQRLSTIGKASNDNTLNAKITPFPSKTTAPSGSKIYLTVVVGDIAPQQFIDGSKAAIVNAANSTMIGSAGIAATIQQAANEKKFTDYIKDNSLMCPTGQARITPSFEIEKIAPGKTAKWIVHVVGPTGSNPEELKSAYENGLYVAWVNGLEHIAFCSISTVIFGYNINQATPIALKAVLDFLIKHKPAIKEVRFFHWQGNPVGYNIYKKELDKYTVKESGFSLELLDDYAEKNKTPSGFFYTLEQSSPITTYSPLVYELTLP